MPKIGINNRITIPPEIMNAKGWEVGTEVAVVPQIGDSVELTPDALITVRKVQKPRVPKGGDNSKIKKAKI